MPPKELNPGNFTLPCIIDEYELGIGKKGYMLDKIWEYCKNVHRDNTYWWHDHGLEEEERKEIGIKIEKYDPPEVQIETFKVKCKPHSATLASCIPPEIQGVTKASKAQRIPPEVQGFGSIASGLDPVSPVIRLTIEHGINSGTRIVLLARLVLDLYMGGYYKVDDADNMELVIRNMPHGARFIMAKAGTTSKHPRSHMFVIETDEHIKGTLDGSKRPYPSWDDVDWMVPYEAFACRCGAGDIVPRESYKPKTREERVRLLVGSPGASTNQSYSTGPSTTPSYSTKPSTPPSYSPGPSRNAECANCKLLIGKLQVLEAILEMYMHPKRHTIDSTALLHELYNDMGKFSLE
ncbi:hypothetical protein Tco_0792531 [Tanacetum coccineum]